MAKHEIDLVREELRDLTTELIDTSAAAPFGAYVWAGNEPGAELGRHCERVVFEEVFGNSPELLAEQYGPYEDASIFFCVVDHKRRLPAGALRVIRPSDAGFKSLADLATVWGHDVDEALAGTRRNPDLGRAWDIATLAVDADYRGEATKGLVSLALYQATTSTADRAGAHWWATILDVVVLELIQSQLARPFEYFRGVEPMTYLDSPSSVPVWCDVPRWSERLAAINPDMHEMVFGGRGLEGAVTPVDWDRAVELAGMPVEAATR